MSAGGLPVTVARAAVPVVAFASYAWTASPALGWLDAPELVAASVNLGVAHPPGEPPPVLLAKLVSLLPVGDLAFRVAIASAIAVALAAAALARATEGGLARVAPGLCGATRALLGAGAGLAFAWSWAAWFQAVRAEVYGLTAALLFAALALVTNGGPSAPSSRAVRLAALCGALAVATHSFVAAAFLAPCAVFVLARRPGWRALASAGGLAALGLTVVLYLPLRAARDPEPNWGDPDSPGRLAWVLTARAFQKSLDGGEAREGFPSEGRSPLFELAQVGGALVEQAGPAGAIAALLALYLLLRRPGARDLALLGLGLVGCVALPPALIGFDADNPDAYGYLAPAVGVLSWLAVLAIGRLADAARTLGPRLVPAAAVALVFVHAGAQAATHARAATLRGSEHSETWARGLLDVPPRAVVVTSYFESAFLVLGLRALEGARPDVIHVDRSQLTQPGEVERARRLHPELATLLDDGLAITSPWPTGALRGLARSRPTYLELWKDVPVGLDLASAGPLALVVLERGSIDHGITPRPPVTGDWLGARVAPALGTGRDAIGLRRLLLVTAYAQARAACAGVGLDPQPRLGVLAAIAPDDPDVGALREACAAGAR